MKVQSERLPGSVARLEIEVGQEQLDREMERAYRRLSGRVQVPGFRRGKAPRVLVERALGEGALLQEATQSLVPDAIADALQQEQLDPVGEPEAFNVLEMEPFRFEVTVPLVPTVTLGDYRTVRAERRPVEVSDEEVGEVIERLREREASWVTPDPPRPAQSGDQLTVDIQDFVEDVPLGGVQEDLTVVLGEGPLMEELDRQLVGAEEGEEYDLEATLPDDHRDEDLAGKPARFHVKVKSIQEKVLPELDDEFAGRIGEDVSTLAELRDRVRDNLAASKAAEERNRLVEDVVSQVVQASSVEMPDVLVEREIDHRVEHLEGDLRRQGIQLDQFLSLTGRSRREMRDEFRDSARERLTRGLVLSEVAHAENLEVDDADLERETARLTEGVAEEELPQVRELLATEQWQERLRSDAYDRKLLNHLVEMATGEPLDATLTRAEEAPVGDADVEILDTIEDMDAEKRVEEIVAPDETDAEQQEQPAEQQTASN